MSFVLINCVLLNLLCVEILLYNANSHSSFTFVVRLLFLQTMQVGGESAGAGSVMQSSWVIFRVKVKKDEKVFTRYENEDEGTV